MKANYRNIENYISYLERNNIKVLKVNPKIYPALVSIEDTLGIIIPKKPSLFNKYRLVPYQKNTQ